MKTGFKRLTALSAAALLAVSALAGCGGSSAKATEAASTAAASEAASDAASD